MVTILRNKGTGAKACAYIADSMEREVSVVRADEGQPYDQDVLIRWGSGAEGSGKKALNTAKAIYGTSDKRNFRRRLAEKDLAPRYWDDLYSLQKSGFKNPVIVRPTYHQRSEEIYLCETLSQVQKVLDKESMNEGYYISEFIDKVKEYRAFVAQGRIVFMIEKFPPDKKSVSWGCVADGDFEFCYWSEWPLAVAKCAVDSFLQSGLHFGAVDVLLDKSGKAYTLEINTAPYLTPFYAERVAKVLDYMIDKESSRLPEIPENATWKNFIHPAITEKAI